MIQVNNVSFRYQNTFENNLNHINLHIKKGECVLLCGPSGCGKTTLFRLLNGLIPYFFKGELKGDIWVDNMNITETPMYEISEKVGSVFQNPKTQFFNVDTDSEIAFGLENMAVSQPNIEKRVVETAEKLNILNLQNRNIFELSGGEKQKIAFASVYAMNPDIYLLDEPSSNIDTGAIREFTSYLKGMKEQGKTIVITEHRLYYLMDIVDRIIYMQDGEIKKSFSVQEFMQLSSEARKRMGLRTSDLSQINPTQEKHILKPSKQKIEFHKFSVLHKKTEVLKHIDFKAQGGEIIAVTGKNGVGKTTFSRAVCGLHMKTSGTVLINQKVAGKKDRCKQSFMVMQDVNYELFAENVEQECTLGITDVNSTAVDNILRNLKLLRYKKAHPNTLSGGQKQRLALAVSALCGKSIIVLDEPTSGLDYESMLEAGTLMKRLAEQDKIIVVVTHDVELICQCCTRILNFADGELVCDLPVTIENKERIGVLF